ncbi:MAG: hypothetical protein MUC87_08855 [Bacteroidia bacterium]|jgi:hypothetical protein|nr:hypothetical protein [Bacteroidia bacterium]
MRKKKITKLPVVHVLPFLAQGVEESFSQPKLAKVNALLARFGSPLPAAVRP